ncbi:ester cyclase [Methylobacterium sp. C1]|uniref:ester cyclase n=1 Tax=Methylobacterium sp. C1 TaxID=1479019 RepID=UPI000AA35FAC|nr:ester cyclase [Methylobacterium sp. C1]
MAEALGRVAKEVTGLRVDYLAEDAYAARQRPEDVGESARAWHELGGFVGERFSRNGNQLGVMGYRAMLERDVATIPDPRFEIELVVAEGDRIASRLVFDCHPAAAFMGVAVSGRRVRFAENVFPLDYRERLFPNLVRCPDRGLGASAVPDPVAVRPPARRDTPTVPQERTEADPRRPCDDSRKRNRSTQGRANR